MFAAAGCREGTYEIADGFQRGTLLNRWYDKLQIIVCENGIAGVNFEHSGVDGHTVLRFASDVFTDTIMRFAQSISGGLPSLLQTSKSTEATDTAPRKLEWELPPAVKVPTCLCFLVLLLDSRLTPYSFPPSLLYCLFAAGREGGHPLRRGEAR